MFIDLFSGCIFYSTGDSKMRKRLVEVQDHDGQYEVQAEKAQRNQTSKWKCKDLLTSMLVEIGEPLLEGSAVRGTYKIKQQTHVVSLHVVEWSLHGIPPCSEEGLGKTGTS